MPIYVFQCEDCGLQFEKLFKSISGADNAAPCEACGTPAQKQVTAANHKFKHAASQLRGPLPPNTGTSDDWKFDKVIGRDAEKKWKHIEARTTEKNRIVKQEAKAGRGITRNHLVPTGDSDGNPYRVITEPERKATNAHRVQAQEARKNLAALPGE